ncbi:hypothetical protein [Aureivirga sp. CE67]|uniref:hypothetical protein n=1 Tax=Aureivirga sp. CE67 TaxID=1788983 RepID=UPI0018CA6B42|nr:hypothetical protein [Aureivirga sp. CE67]
MISRYYIILLLFIFISCKTNFYLLKNNKTKVPKNNELFKTNSSPLDKKIFSKIDTNAVYEEYNILTNVPARLDYNNVENSIYNVYRFYSNGCFNSFYLDRDDFLHKKDFDPETNGRRGVFHIKNNKVVFKLFTEINQMQKYGIADGYFEIYSDTIYMIRPGKYPIVRKYVKRKLSNDYLNFKANWYPSLAPDPESFR